MKKRLVSTLIGATVFGISLLPYNAKAEVDDFSGLGMAGSVLNGEGKGFSSRVYTIGPSMQNTSEASGHLNLVHGIYKSDTLHSEGTELGVEGKVNVFLGKFPFYWGMGLGISHLSGDMRDMYQKRVSNWNKTVNLSAGFAFVDKDFAFTVGYNLRHVSNLSNLGFLDGLNTEGWRIGFSAAF